MKILLPVDLGEITNIRVFHDNSGLFKKYFVTLLFFYIQIEYLLKGRNLYGISIKQLYKSRIAKLSPTIFNDESFMNREIKFLLNILYNSINLIKVFYLRDYNIAIVKVSLYLCL